MSAIRRDWLERLIQQLAQVLARALGFRASGSEAQALEEIHRATADLFGIPRSMLLALDARAALQVLDHPRVRDAALRLLDEEESILRAQGKVADADALAGWLARTRSAAAGR
jgi:hypothetical protein